MQIKPHSHLAPDTRAVLAATFVAQYRAGHSVRWIAANAGLSYGRVYRLLRSSGVILRKRGAPRRDG